MEIVFMLYLNLNFKYLYELNVSYNEVLLNSYLAQLSKNIIILSDLLSISLVRDCLVLKEWNNKYHIKKSIVEEFPLKSGMGVILKKIPIKIICFFDKHLNQVIQSPHVILDQKSLIFCWFPRH